jgi:hypothetical protein
LAPTSPQGRVSIAEIARGLEQVRRSGVRVARLRECSDLLALQCVRDRMGGRTDPDVLAFGLERVLLEAIEGLGDGPRREAARRLFGVVPAGRGELLKVRRKMAADHLRMNPSTFRQQYEPELLMDIAAEVLRIEIGAPRLMT